MFARNADFALLDCWLSCETPYERSAKTKSPKNPRKIAQLMRISSLVMLAVLPKTASSDTILTILQSLKVMGE